MPLQTGSALREKAVGLWTSSSVFPFFQGPHFQFLPTLGAFFSLQIIFKSNLPRVFFFNNCYMKKGWWLDTEKAMAPHSSTLAWKIPWTEEPGRLQSMGSLSRTWLRDFTFTSHFHALEKEMATHSSVLARRIPGMGEPGGLPSVGSHRVGHDWSGLAAAAAAMSW